MRAEAILAAAALDALLGEPRHENPVRLMGAYLQRVRKRGGGTGRGALAVGIGGAACAPAWSAGACAEAAAVAALSAEGVNHVERTVRDLAAERESLAGGLAGLLLAPHPSSADYLCVRVPDAPRREATLRREGMRVRDCATFGLADHVRVAVRTPCDDERLLAAIAEARCTP